MASIGKGVKEIRIHEENQYRIIYLASSGNNVYVLHAFCKKTQKTPRKELDIAKKRFAESKQMRVIS